MRKFLIVTLAFAQLSCSDFFNSGGKGDLPPEKPRRELGNNPFEPGFDPTVGPFSETKMLANIGLNVIAPATREFRLQVENLLLEMEAQSSASVLQDRWSKAMMAFHFVDAVPVGPLSDEGRILADQIYGWPNFNACGIDLEVAKMSLNGSASNSLLFTVKGLAAIEYLLFEKNLITLCNPNNPRHQLAVEWSKKDTAEKRADRAAYALYIAKDLLAQARRLEKAWDPQGANYSKILVDGSRYPTLKEATNALSDAIFAIEDLKDRRLGRPLGLHKDCVSSSRKCPEMVEHPWSGMASAATAQRLNALLAVVRGHRVSVASGFGLDDLLLSVGHEDVGVRFVDVVSKAAAAAREMEALGPLAAQIDGMDADACKRSTTDDRAIPACALFQDVRAVSTFMKIEFLTVLSLRAPPKYQGDND